jgi:valyl-tRNA synthetase
MLEKTFDPKSVEPRLYAAWEASGAFSPDKTLARDPDAEPFCMVIPPPNVTGSLHVGHALNDTLQDVLARFHRMRGRAVLWLPGTDHAGIATQMMVERELSKEGNVSRREMGREAFVERVWKWKAESGGTIVRQMRRLGCSCDWSRERFTLDDGLSAAVRKVFVQLYKDGLIYRDKRLVNWHPELQTAISDLEVENIETKGSMWRFRYPLDGGVTYQHPVAFDDGGKPTEWETRDYIVVATTRPETMLGDAAVAVHADDERYRPLLEAGAKVRLPLTGRLIPIVADEHADPEKGTGAVKITPAHDFNDFQVGKRQKLEFISIFDQTAKVRVVPIISFPFEDQDGTIKLGPLHPANTPLPENLSQLDRFAARKRVVAEMESLGLLDGVDAHMLAIPMDEKSKSVVIEPYLTDQWYVDAAVLAKPALEAVRSDLTIFEPKHWEKTYFQWLENIEPWCVSRQLWWGHQIPAWYGPTTAGDIFNFSEPKIFVGETEDEVKAEASAFYGHSIEFLPDQKAVWNRSIDRKDGHDKPVGITRDEDVLDTWFSSALWPFSTLGWPEDAADLKRFYPTNVLVTSFDIIFFWVARMMMMGLHFKGDVPFKQVFINALVLDEKGQKMSKTRGNVIDPLELVDEYGADALRFTLTAMSGPARNIRLSKQRVEGYRNFGTKLWNAARFCQMNECVTDPAFDPAAATGVLNRWLRGELAKTAEAVAEAVERFAFDEAAGALYRFIWNTFCDWHLELAKPILNGEDEAAKAEVRAMTAWALDQTLKLLHPVAPFITEELWAATAEFGPPREGLLIEAPWPDLPAALIDPEAEAEIGWLIDLVSDIRSIRSEMNVPPSAKPPLALIGVGDETRARVARHRPSLLALGRLESVSFADAPPAGAASFPTGEATAALSIAAFIDVAAERARLQKALAAAEGEIERVDRKLGNADFMAKAPESVVAENREKRAEAEAARAKLLAALARLQTVG